MKTPAEVVRMSEEARNHEACVEIALRLAEMPVRNKLEVSKIKREVSRKYGLRSMPRDADVLAAAKSLNIANLGELELLLKEKPVRTISGVAPVAVMTSPHPCPHGRCIMCPGGPDSAFKSPQSYVGREPAALRGAQNDYDPYKQVQHRLRQLREIGHDVTKVELILMGGTLTARSEEYQRWFVNECLRAMEDFARRYGTEVRNVGTTFETRPDYAREREIDLMLELGATKVELGVQHIDNDVLELIKRGHTVEDTVEANRRLRDSALKVGFHIMPGLPGSDFDRDLKMFERIFEDVRFKPDYLKIYPTLVLEGTELYEMWKRGEYEPLDDEKAAELVANVKKIVPKWVRIQRVQRDIPAQLIVAGVKKSNLRQLALARLREMGFSCRCIRCREAGHSYLRGKPPEDANIELLCESYEACGGKEFFISYEDVENDVLVAFLRLRFPCRPHRPELEDAALIRELHVYGEALPLSARKSTSWQHRGFGAALLKTAEELAAAEGFEKIAVMSGIGVREYYMRFGYRREGPFMTKPLS